MALAKGKTGTKTLAVDKEPRVRGLGAQTVYDALRLSILELTLQPGSPLDEVRLSQQVDMSRTPIREARCGCRRRGW